MEDDNAQTEWEERWATPGDLSWRITEIPRDLQEALDQGWFAPGADVLDIGCGSGECAAWLAQQGCTVLGIDFAANAIAQAKASHGERQQLQFAVLDICRAAPERPFQALFDRGCLHVIPAYDRPAYVRQIAAAATPGAHFLLLHKTMGAFFEQTPSYRQTAAQLRREFEDTFDLIDSREIMIPRMAGPQPEPPVPGLAIRLVRKTTQETSLMTAAPDRSASADMSRRSAEIEMAGLDAPPLSVLQAGIAWRRPEEIENSIPARFERIAALQPNAPAVIDKTTPLTYAMLNQAANRLAHELLAEGATPVVATGYLFGHGASQIVAMLGILKTGGCCVPVDLALPDALNREILADAQVRLIVTDDEHLTVAAALAPAGARIVNLERLRPELPETNLELPIDPDRLANLHYTSGSTGKPKGVMQNHRNTLHFMATTGAIWPIQPGDRVVHLISCSFSAVVLPIWGGLLNGAAVAPCDPRQAGIAGLQECLRDQRITTYFSVPTLYRRLAERLEQTGDSLPELKVVVLGGEPLVAADIATFQRTFPVGCRLLNLYAGAEMYNVCHYPVDREIALAGPTAPAGYPIEGKELLLLDETRRPVALGEAGEIAVRSRYLAPGYLNQPELTAAAFLPDPDGGDRRIYPTGDLGRLEADGCLVHLGRQNAMVKLRGQRVELGAVEAVLHACPGVADAAAALRTGAGGEQALVAYVVRQPAAALTARVLRATLRERLPEVMVPQRVVFMDTFPVTSSGKLDRQALPRPGRAGPDLDTPFVAPRTEQEQQIADIWAELLGLDAVGVEDNFYDLGGDSILALRMALAVEQVTGRRVPPDFFRTPRIAYLADPAANTPAPVSLEPSPDRRRTAADKARSLLRLTPHRVVRRLAYDGPVWGEHGLPYTMGTRIQHLLCRNRFFQQQVFAQECAIFHTWLEATRQVDDEPVLLTRHLMANTWLQWRRATLRSSEQWAKIVAITGAELLDRRQRQGRGVVLVVPHYADSIWIRRSVEGYEPIHIFRGAGQSATDEQRTRLHSERLVDANLVLARGGVVLIAIDSTHGKRGVEVPFFGYKMPFRSGAAELAATTGADMVFATWRLGVDGRMTVDFRTAPGGQEGDHECKVDDLLNQYATLMTAAWPVLLPSLSFGALYSNTVSLPRLDG